MDCRVKPGNDTLIIEPLQPLFRRAHSLATMRNMDDPEQPRQEKYVETARDRRIANALLLFFVIVVVGGGIWLANAMFEQRQLDDCLAQGGRNCAPAIEAPAR
jgi:hypothetical protein